MEQLPKLSLLGIVIGVAVGAVVLGFRQLIDWIPQLVFCIDSEAFHDAPTYLLVLAPVVGAIVIDVLRRVLKVEGRNVGVVHVMHRLQDKTKKVDFPLRNVLLQFFGGTTALASGFSGGSEGPAIHLGAAGASYFTKRLKLSEDGMRTLLAAGMAAGVTAIFETPIAAVILTMEVVLLEVALASLLPVMLAAVAAKTLVVLTIGENFIITNQAFAPLPPKELGFIVLAGVFIGLVATFFNYSIHLFSTLRVSFTYRILIVALATSLCAWYMPEVLGIGTDTLKQLLKEEHSMSIGMLGMFILLKVLLTTFSVGLGTPTGIIGPTLVIGAAMGTLVALVAGLLIPEMGHFEFAMFTLIGLAAMMGAVLNCPLAALITVLEIGRHTDLVLPAILMIVAANLTCGPLYGRRSVFLGRLEAMTLFEERRNTHRRE